MKKLLRFSLMALFSLIGSSAMAQDSEPEVTLDFTTNDVWEFPTEKTVAEGTFTNNGYEITVVGGGNSNGYYFFTNNSSAYSCLMLGKSGATLTLPAFDFDVERIDVVGTSGASAAVKQNIFVDGNAVSTETVGAKDVTNEYWINEDNQSSGTIYTLKVTSSANTQISKILIWKTGTAPGEAPQPKTVTTVKFSNKIEGGLVDTEIDLAEVTVVDADGNAIDGAEVTWTSKNQEVAVISGTKLQLLSVGSSSITATYAGDDSYKDSKASYTVTVFAEAEDFPSIHETITTSAKPTVVDFHNVTVTKVHNYLSQSGNPLFNVYLSDENHYGLMIYASGEGNDIGLKEGQVLNGQAFAKKQNYKGTYELTNFSKEGLTITEGTVEPIEMTISEIDVKHQCSLVTVKGVKFASGSDADGNVDGYFSDGNYSLVYKDKFEAEPALEDGETYDVTGIIIIWDNTPCISPRTADDITLAASTNIQNLTIDTDASAPIYTLDGRRVDQNYRGVVIQNGVKRIQK